ncbi:Uncharacterised protein [Mycobacteroides abscessus subsp. abscessus]|uniref:DUF6883 domain-containing protein n=1 Tax=Mycobacteroides abscessus TaxID=36809 RepID=UPI000926E8B5|nr:DUF6883 domain-containing protein [Mycobacteroides abscessus]SHT89537.1 Uncharacterised protein [Mycobacteroides abscessus subsp. abscessus]SLL32993.1 Uncharacterised protein [Mycobacteroides abscessus subsp. abscessus]
MAVASFLVTHQSAAGSCDDNDLCARIARTLIAGADHDSPVQASVRSGLALFHTIVERIQQVHAPKASPRSVGWRTVVDHRALSYVLADFAEVFRDGWHVGDAEVIDRVVLREVVEAYSVGPIDLDTAERVHQALHGAPGYLGALQIDLGHPVLYQVLWSGLIPRYQVVGTQVGFVDCYPPGEDPEALGVEWGWWREVAASETYWTDSFDVDRVLANIGPAPDSPRGATVRAGLKQLLAPSTLERTAQALLRSPESLATDGSAFTVDLAPDAVDAVVPEEKLRGYALNLRHNKGINPGKHKARMFRDRLGIRADDWQYLAEQLRRGVRTAPVLRELRTESHGVKFSVITAVRGRNDAVEPVLSAWIVRPGNPPQLTTTYPISHHQEMPDPEDPVAVLSPSDRQDWALLWRVATAAADSAADLVVPEPIFVTGGRSGQWYREGTVGYASVRVDDARRGFGRWLRRNGHAQVGHLPGAWVPAPAYGYETATAWARVFAEILQWNGISCEMESAMD